jgi:hypothetical protein
MKLGDKLYKYLSFNGFGSYIIIGIKTVPKCKMYEIECQACTDHEKCTMYVVKEKKGKYKFVCMTNDDEEENRHQQMWHDDDYFYSDLQEGRKALYELRIKEKKEQIVRQEEGLEGLNKALKDLEEHYQNIK